jgi:hypothetical protein
MSTDVRHRFDPREEQREVLRRRRFRKKLWRKGIRWIVFSSVILVTVFIFLEAMDLFEAGPENKPSPIVTRDKAF